MHRRAAIRAAIVMRVTGLATTGANVTAGRVYPDTVPTLPGLNVVTGEETTVEEENVVYARTAGQQLQNRALEMAVECRAAGDALDDQLDQIALEVEAALAADATLGGECDKIEIATSSASELAGEIESPVGLRTLNYMVMYRVDARDPQALEA